MVCGWHGMGMHSAIPALANGPEEGCPARKGGETQRWAYHSWSSSMLRSAAPIGRGLKQTANSHPCHYEVPEEDCPDRKGVERR